MVKQSTHMKLKFISVESFIQALVKILVRFPIPLAITLAGTASIVALIGNDFSHETEIILQNIFSVSFVGMPLMISIQLIVERMKWRGVLKWAFQIVGLSLLVFYYSTLPSNFWDGPQNQVYRFFLLLIAVHLLVAVAPFLKNADEEQFWNFNKTLFLRMFTGGIYSLVLFLGGALAIWSLEMLFGLNIDSDLYPQLWFTIIGIFNTCFFLYGVPQYETDDEKDFEFPVALKFFSSYILLPLVILYLIILYCYGTKIIINWSWPNGWVSNLLIGFSIVGILAQLLVYPIRNNENNKWIRQWSRFFFIIILPLLLMLFLAIFRRIQDYGITENRYFILITAIWLSAISINYIIKQFNNIRLIPMSLLFVTIISLFGPLSSFSVSEKSQLNQLTKILEETNALKDGHVIPYKTSPVDSTFGRINNTTEYLVEHFGLEALQSIFSFPLQYAFDKSHNDSSRSEYNDRYNQDEFAMHLMGLEYQSYWSQDYSGITSASFYTNQNNSISDVKGFENMYALNIYSGNTSTVVSNGNTYEFMLEDSGSTLTISKNNTNIFTLDFLPYVKSLKMNYGSGTVPQDEFFVLKNNSAGSFKFIFNSVQANQKNNELTSVTEITAQVFWTLTDKP